jgi:hypothetical protein
MLCSLLKAFKVYFLSTALFQSSGTVFKDDKQKTVAVSYSLSSDIHSVNSSITAIYDHRYRSCFMKSINEASYLLNTPDVSFRVKSWKKARPTQSAFFFRLKKPTKKPRLTTSQLKRLPISKQIIIRVDAKRNATRTNTSNASSSSSSAHSTPNNSPRSRPPTLPPAPPSGDRDPTTRPTESVKKSNR